MQHGQYEIIEEIGRGGTCIVYKARDVLLERVVALKVFPAEFFPDAERTHQREVEILSRLNHPNIVRVLDAGKAVSGVLY